MKNYYEILEVDIHASDEIIDKAYKLLAKRYHPDTQPEEKKQWAEEKFKELSEAYEVLSNKDKRESYTNELEFERENQFYTLSMEKASLENLVKDLQNRIALLESYSTQNFQQSEQSKEEIFYNDIPSNQSYSYYTNNLEREIPKQTYYYEKVSRTWKERFHSLSAFFITIIIIILFGFLLWKIPFTQTMLKQLYEENLIIQSIIDFFLRFFV